MLFAVIIGDSPGEHGHADPSGDERRSFLEALRREGQLLLEATYGETGSLMILDAASTNEALGLLHNDPRVLASSRVQIRPAMVNVVGSLPVEAGGEPTARKPRRRSSARRGEGRGPAGTA